MLGPSLLFLVVVSAVVSMEDFECNSDGECGPDPVDVICHCTPMCPNFTKLFLTGTQSTRNLSISNCSSIELGPGYLQASLPLAHVTFRHAQNLVLETCFPPELEELRFDHVRLQSISLENFSGDTRLRHLRVTKSTIDEVKRDTFELVAVENAHFEDVDFVTLEEDSLAFSYATNESAVISFHACRFPDVDFSPVSVAAPGRIRFVDNVIDCSSLARVYTWIDAMLGNQHGREGLLCRYLDENFCDAKREANKLMWKFLDSGMLSGDVGLNLERACPESYRDYVEGKKLSGVSDGRRPAAGFAVFVVGLGVLALGM